MLGTLATGNLTAISTGSLNLGQGTVSGTLAANSNGGAITQAGGLTVTGASTVNAGAGNITLTQAGLLMQPGPWWTWCHAAWCVTFSSPVPRAEHHR